MKTVARHPKYYSLKILAITPYYSKILMPTPLQVHCFHRPEGEGVPPAPRVQTGRIRDDWTGAYLMLRAWQRQYDAGEPSRVN